MSIGNVEGDILSFDLWRAPHIPLFLHIPFAPVCLGQSTFTLLSRHNNFRFQECPSVSGNLHPHRSHGALRPQSGSIGPQLKKHCSLWAVPVSAGERVAPSLTQDKARDKAQDHGMRVSRNARTHQVVILSVPYHEAGRATVPDSQERSCAQGWDAASRWN